MGCSPGATSWAALRSVTVDLHRNRPHVPLLHLTDGRCVTEASPSTPPSQSARPKATSGLSGHRGTSDTLGCDAQCSEHCRGRGRNRSRGRGPPSSPHPKPSLGQAARTGTFAPQRATNPSRQGFYSFFPKTALHPTSPHLIFIPLFHVLFPRATRINSFLYV